jgi:hypothetical protein
MVESQLVDVDRVFDQPDPKLVYKKQSLNYTNFRLINQMINQQRTINSVKSQSVLNKTVENNYFRVQKPRQVVTYGNQLVKRKREQKVYQSSGAAEPSRAEVTKSLLQSIYDHQLDPRFQTYDIKRLDYYLLARKIEALKKSKPGILVNGETPSLEPTLFEQLKGYYQKAIRYEKIPLRELDQQRFLEAENEIISVLLHYELIPLLEQDRHYSKSSAVQRLRSSLTVFVNNQQSVLVTGYNQPALLVLLGTDSIREEVSLKVVDRTKGVPAESKLLLVPNRLLSVPHLNEVSFDPPFSGQHCIMLIFSFQVSLGGT